MCSRLMLPLAFRRFVQLTLVVLLGAVLAFSPSTAPATSIKPLLQYQGLLTDPSTGEPIKGQVFITFRLFADSEQLDTFLWSEDHELTVESGLVSVILGQRNPLEDSLFRGTELWLEIIVNETKLTPLQPLLPTAFALRANTATNAEQLQGLQPGAFVRTAGPATISSSSSAPTLTVNQSNTSATALAVQGTVDAEHVHAESMVANRFEFDEPREYYLFVGPHEFKPDNSRAIYSTGINGAFITGWDGTPPFQQRLVAPVHLPNGARVTQMRVWMHDDSETQSIQASLTRIAPPDATGIGTLVVNSANLGDEPYVTGFASGSGELIDTETTTYWISAFTNRWDLQGADLRIRGARITYTMDEVY